MPVAGCGAGASVATGAAVCAVASVGKELWDCVKKKPTGFDWRDLVADAVGMCAGLIVFFAIFCTY